MSSGFDLVKRLALVCLVAVAFAYAAALLLSPPASGRTLQASGKDGDGYWRIGSPISYKNLTLFPVLQSRGRHVRTDDYITLDEGLRNGTVVITEKGSSGQTARSNSSARRTRQGVARQPTNQVQVQGNQVQVQTNQAAVDSDEGDSVNQLALVNRSGKKLLLLAGEVIVGGKQDRIVEQDLIVPANNVAVNLNVFCVEHGRWSSRTEGRSGRQVVQPLHRDGAGPSTRMDIAAARPAESFSSLGAISHPKLRAAAQDKKAQSEVWEEVSANNKRLGTSNSTDTYQEVYASKAVGGRLENYVAAFEKGVLNPDTVGVIVARNGQLVWVDCFASPSLFARYWPKLLKSYVVDAMGDQPKRSQERPSVEQAFRYFLERDGEVSLEARAGVYRVSKTDHPRYASFRLDDMSYGWPVLLHFNKMQR